MEECKVTICYNAGCGKDSPLVAGLVVAASLLLSNNIRRYACADVVFGIPIGSRCLWYRLRVSGSRVKGFRMDERTVMGIMKRLLSEGKWPGTSISRIEMPTNHCEDCMPAEAFLAQRKCPTCISLEPVEGLRFNAWWLASAVMVVYDDWCT